jgi:uncharacterized protein
MFIDFSSKPPHPAFADASQHMSNYENVYTSKDRGGEGALDRYLAEYEQLGASKVVLKARCLKRTFGFETSNTDVAEFCSRHGDRFIGFASVDPFDGIDAVWQLEHAVRELGLRGLSLSGFELDMTASDARCYPLYAKCIELNIPVHLHCGVNFSTDCAHDCGHPRHLDAVMRHFPQLKVIAAPPGWPWVQELVALALRHRNLHIGIAAVKPRYLAKPGSGYEPVVQHGALRLKDRIIFGSAYPLIDPAAALDDIAALPLSEEARRAWLHDNAARLLGLPLAVDKPNEKGTADG